MRSSRNGRGGASGGRQSLATESLHELALQVLSPGALEPGESADAGPRIVAVTSAREGEGKSFVCAALGRSAAALGLRVLLIDANLDRPTLHTLLDCKNADGLSDALQANDPRTALVQPTSDPRLALIPAGSHGLPALLLRPGILRWLLQPLGPGYDCVLVDCGALERGGAHLCQESDGGLLVVDASHTRAEVIRAALDRVRLPEAKLLGTVLNKRPQYIPRWLYGSL